MYQVILVSDESNSKNYFYSYVESYDTSLGNISVESLPGYADINQARACYWEDNQWNYDEDKYNAIIVANQEAAVQAKVELSSAEKLNLFANTIQVEDATKIDGVTLPNRYGYAWKNTCEVVDGIATIGWEQVKIDGDFKTGSSKTDAIPWIPNDYIIKDLYYNVAGAYAKAKKSGCTSKATDTAYFSYVLT